MGLSPEKKPALRGSFVSFSAATNCSVSLDQNGVRSILKLLILKSCRTRYASLRRSEMIIDAACFVFCTPSGVQCLFVLVRVVSLDHLLVEENSDPRSHL